VARFDLTTLQKAAIRIGVNGELKNRLLLKSALLLRREAVGF
jgi:hypothetical protein